MSPDYQAVTSTHETTPYALTMSSGDRTFGGFVSLQTLGLRLTFSLFDATSVGLMMDYDLANYLLASLPADEREQTVASLRQANAAEFRRMRETLVRSRLLEDDQAAENVGLAPRSV
jgi:hypothetical protein